MALNNLFWFKVACDLHGNQKIAQLSDAQFRVLVYLWARAQRSSTPGVIYNLIPDFAVKASGAKNCGCIDGPDEEHADGIFSYLEAAGLIRIAPEEGHAIYIHDWEDHNPTSDSRKFPSQTTEAKRIQKRKERQSTKHVATDVASDMSLVATTDQSRVDKKKSREEKRASRPDVVDADPPPKATTLSSPKAAKTAGRTIETREAYKTAYRQRWGADPLLGKTENGKLATFVDAVGIELAPLVAAFYVTHNQALYVAAKHPLNLLVRDAAKIHTEWKTGRQTTMIGAQLQERTAENVGSWSRHLSEGAK